MDILDLQPNSKDYFGRTQLSAVLWLLLVLSTNASSCCYPMPHFTVTTSYLSLQCSFWSCPHPSCSRTTVVSTRETGIIKSSDILICEEFFSPEVWLLYLEWELPSCAEIPIKSFRPRGRLLVFRLRFQLKIAVCVCTQTHTSLGRKMTLATIIPSHMTSLHLLPLLI